MMRRQGYNTSEEDKFEFFKDFEGPGMKDKFMDHYIKIVRKFKMSIPQTLTKLYMNEEGKTKQCYYMNESDSATGDVLIDQIKKMFMDIGSIRNVVIISPGKLGPNTKAALIDYPSHNFTCFTFKELMYDPFESDLVPQHILLNKQETKMFFKENPNIKEDDLPRVFENDAPIKRLNGKAGQIVYIHRRMNRTESLSRYSMTIRRIVSGDLPVKKKK